MNRTLDRVTLLMLGLVFFLPCQHRCPPVLPLLTAVLLSSLLALLEARRSTLLLFGTACALCFVWPDFLLFLPLVCYDVFSRFCWLLVLPTVLPLAFAAKTLSAFQTGMGCLLLILACLTAQRTDQLQKARADYICLRDSNRELMLQLEDKNHELMEKQDYEIRIATLDERNRIAREIHDSVGHLLSSSILQLGALQTICKDPALQKNLHLLQNTLTQGMDSIRCSVHALYNDSIDLQAEAERLTQSFRFCPAVLSCDLQEAPPKDVKYTFLAILKEGLTNVARHSNATHVTVTLREHPGFYQLIIKDNGCLQSQAKSDGIGLQNICSRVKGLHGSFHIYQNSGFTLFVTVPKEESKCES